MTDLDLPILEPPAVDVTGLRAHRLGRVREQLTGHGVDLAVITNPVSLRYVADWREYALFQSHIPTYDLFVTPDGAMTMFGAYAEDHPVIDEFRPGHYLNVFDGGPDLEAAAKRFAADVEAAAGAGATVALDHASPAVTQALEWRGIRVVDVEPLIEAARSVKCRQELRFQLHAITVAEAALAAIRERARPGVTENELFAVLYATNVANGGDWIDGRMLCSGPRTNPWYQEASDRPLEDGDLLAIDTDMIGPHGYCADISRTWLVGDGEPTPEQRDRYRRAKDEITYNAALLAPGMSFRELTQKSFRQTDEFVAHRYACLVHGVGMTDEWPKVYHRADWDQHGYDGEFVAGMVLSVESFVGSERGGPGVKLEQMHVLTNDGATPLSAYPFEEALLR